MTVSADQLRPGAEVTVRGIGRCRVRGPVLDDAGALSHVDVYDPRNGGLRSVLPERVLRVHRLSKLREG